MSEPQGPEFDLIKAALHEALNERDGLDRETHRAHHDYLNRRIEIEMARERRRAEVHVRVKATVLGGLVMIILTGVGGMMYNVGRAVMDIYHKSAPFGP